MSGDADAVPPGAEATRPGADAAAIRYLGGRKFLACETYLVFSFVLALADKLTPLWATCGGIALAVYTGTNAYLQRSAP